MRRLLRAPITVVASREGSKGHFAWSRFATLLTTHSRYSHKRIKPACIRGSSASRSKHNARRFPWRRSTAAALLYTLLAFCVQPAQAQQHPQGHDPYVDWKTRNGISCCHGRDCAPAIVWQDMDGNWFARQNGQTYSVPEHAVLPIQSPDGRSHACVIGGIVICLVPGEVRG